jgi:hypothetical protein
MSSTDNLVVNDARFGIMPSGRKFSPKLVIVNLYQMRPFRT